MNSVIPPVTTADDLSAAIAAGVEDPGIRWYSMKMADSFRLLDQLPADWEISMVAANREFSSEVRERYAGQGIALPDGSFPIPDKDALRRAIASIGRASDYDRARRHIIKRARALKAVDMLPGDWSVTASAGNGDDDMIAEMLILQRKNLERHARI
jgi:hypothetical protein